ncbi:MAG: hypothetical protein WA823_07585 [Candidatus Acidiferrales bacterium]
MTARMVTLFAMGFLFFSDASVNALSSAASSAAAKDAANMTMILAHGDPFAAGLSNLSGIVMTTKAGAPYSLVQETSRSSTLANGAHIDENSKVIHMYRDSEGRTRMESYVTTPQHGGKALDLATVIITDLATGKCYFLSPQARTATESVMPGLAAMVQNAATPVAAVRTAAAQQVPAAGAAGTTPEMKHETLPAQEMDGLTVTGTRLTQTFPTGSIGNDRPIVVTRTKWYSDELGIDVLSESSDPRSGDTTTRVTQLDRTEPDASLFQVPPGYTIIGTPARP